MSATGVTALVQVRPFSPARRNRRRFCEDRIGDGAAGLRANPSLHQFQPLVGLMNVVPVGEVAEGEQQQFEALDPRQRWGA
jgi:hypothetical protein